MEDSRQSITSYDLHRMHYCWEFKQQCQQAAANEQCQGTMHCLSCGSFTVPKDSHSNQLCPPKTTAQTLLCPPTGRPRHQASSLTCICQCLVVSSALLHRATAAHSLPDRQVHKFIPCSVSLITSPYLWLQGLLVPTPHSLHQSAERGERRGGKGGRKKEQVGTFFRGPFIFYLISQELLDYKSKVC